MQRNVVFGSVLRRGLALTLLVSGLAAQPTRADDPPQPVPAEPPKEAPAAPAPAGEPPPAPAPAPAPAAPEASTPETPKVVEPETVTLAPGPFAVMVELPATFEPVQAAEVAWRPQSMGGEVEVLEAAPPGPVEAGQVLVRLKAPRQEDHLALARLDVAIANANLLRLEEEDKRRDQVQEIQRAAVKREADRAAADLERFLKTDRPLRQAEAELNLEGARNALEDAKEELAQLEKMYKADELTEETEDIVLKRTQRELARSIKRLTFQEQRHAWILEITLPRDLENLEHRARETRLELERFEATAALSLAKVRQELKKAVQEVEFQRQGLARLEADAAALTLRAPKAGRAVPGVLNKGRWTGVDEAVKALRPGQKVRAEQVLMTVFEPGELRLRTSLPEAHLFQVKEGSSGTVSPTAADTLCLPVTVRWISPTALEGKHDTLLALDAGDPRLLPGLSGKLKLRTRERADALTVPEAAISREGEKAFVHVWAEGQAHPRPIKLGASADGQVEVLEGLAAGERVLSKAPCAKS